MPSDKVRRWYTVGADALQRLYPNQIPYGYACPICRLLFLPEALEAGALSVDHAPPQAQGGRPVCLTCVSCNHTAGSTIEAELVKREKVIDFHRPVMADPHPARLTVGDLSVNVILRRDEGGVHLEVRRKKNDPTMFERFVKWAQAGETVPASDVKFAPSPRRLRLNNQRARVASLKSAYLVAFAALGYRWAWQPCLDIVRDQIRRPDEVLIPSFCITLDRDEPGRRELLIVEDPPELRSVAVASGRQGVFLPYRDTAVLDYLDGLFSPPGASQSFLETLRGTMLAWPTQPMHALDPQPKVA